MASVYLNEFTEMREGAIKPEERVRYLELVDELEEVKGNIDLLIRRIKWIEEEVFPEMEKKIARLVDKKIEEIERELRMFQIYMAGLLRLIKVKEEI